MSDRIERAIRELADALRDELRAETAPAAPERLLSLAESTVMLGVGKGTVKSLVSQGRLRSIKVGRRRLVPSDALAEFIADETREGSRNARAVSV